jgi:predicted MFS family arabinose efflux permease
MSDANEVTKLRDLSPTQWRSGIAAWLGWLFDGLDMHLYTLVATPFVALLLSNELGVKIDSHEDIVTKYASWIQAAFLVGWALGGAFFGRIGDRLGRSRALVLTILTYAIFTGVSFFAERWWHLMIFRFLAALGIGGEWAVGASILSETWPKHWRPWIAAVLQSGVNLGNMGAALSGMLLLKWGGLPHRYIFLVGILPALLVLWIRRAVPEPEEWQTAKEQAAQREPNFLELFVGPTRRITLLTTLVCATALSGHWAFVFWSQQQLRNLPGVVDWSIQDKDALVSQALALLMASAIAGNFAAGALAKAIGYRAAIVLLCVAYFVSMSATYSVPRDYREMLWFWPLMGLSQGAFALFTMYLPPLFPTLLRTTGAGFCYNIGRIAAAVGTIYFATTFGTSGDYRNALLLASFLFLPAALFALMLPELPRGGVVVEPVE